MYQSHKDQVSGTPGVQIKDAPWGYQYITALHWAITQFTPGSMHIQPQNIIERMFNVWMLLFGLVVFSSFIASVTQARMQLAKMMSKFERDLWLMRKYCRQNNVSRSLTIRMRRYVDMVLIPKYHNMGPKDVVILPQLSIDLREELHPELSTKKIRVHPFFAELELQAKAAWNRCLMKQMCTSSLEATSHGRGDIIFSPGQKATAMYIVTGGQLEYLPYVDKLDVVQIEKGDWVAEAVLWTEWTHQGQLQAGIEANAMKILAGPLRACLTANGLGTGFAKLYAKEFCKRMNEKVQDDILPSDYQTDITRAINVHKCAHHEFQRAMTRRGLDEVVEEVAEDEEEGKDKKNVEQTHI